MSQVHGLSDDQVGQELRKMTAFIKQEAEEKAREIQIKANEEFSIEKARLVREETDAIDATYDKKFKQASMAQQIAQSTIQNKTRLRVLAARQGLLDDIADDARRAVADAISKDAGRYQETLAGLVLEGLYALDESADVRVRARPEDADVVRKAIDTAVEQYAAAQGVEREKVSVALDEENALAGGPECLGGVIVVGGKGRIEFDNTLDARLSLVQESGLPVIRESLFGKNPNRKFFD